MSTFNWQQPAQKVGEQLGKLGLTYWNNPAAFSGAGAEAGAGASGFSGMGAGGVASVLAPLFMTWSAYTGGSHRNEPVEKYQQTKQIGKLLTDMLAGKHASSDEARCIPFRQATIESETPFSLQMDGEAMLGTQRIFLETLPQKLSILMPQEARERLCKPQ